MTIVNYYRVRCSCAVLANPIRPSLEMKLCKIRKESTKWLEATTQIRHFSFRPTSSFSSANGRHRVFGGIGLVPWTGPNCVGTGAGISLADLAVIKVSAKAGAGRRWLRSVDDSRTGGRISASMRFVVNRRVEDALRLVGSHRVAGKSYCRFLEAGGEPGTDGGG